jgi:hydroxymethylpyrimidine pyrophosphatase-like HAD family hydrolase
MKVENEAETSGRAGETFGVETSPVREADAGLAYSVASRIIQSPSGLPAEASTQYEPLLIHNLLSDLPAMGSVFLTEVRRASWLNAYLLAAGMNQIIEDYLHPDPYFLNKVAGHVAHMRAPVGRLGAGTARSFAAALSFLRRRRGATPDVGRRQVELAALVQELADRVACPTAPPRMAHEKLLASAEAFIASLEHFPRALLREILRLPSCFRSFDQQPADLDRIAREFTRRLPDRRRPLLVVGMRSSGSYLAPLYGAFFKAQGYLDVRVMTMRPGRWLWPREQSLLKATIRRHGLVLFTDDPPVSGATLAEAAGRLEQIGVPARSIIMLLQLFGSSDVPPPRLQRYMSVVLPWKDWAIHTLLEPITVRAALADLLAPARTGITVTRLPPPPHQWERGHAHALYKVGFIERATDRGQEQLIYVQGAGLGYFGEHALAIGRAVGPFVPEIYGVREGLLYREWLPDEQRIDPNEPGMAFERATAMIAYVEARHHALAVKEDVSLRLTGRLPAWEVASNLLSRAFGRGWIFARMPTVDPIVKRLLRCTDPSVIDGSMTPAHWFTEAGMGQRLLKVDFSERAFCNRDLYCYDPIFDVACMAASMDLTEPAFNCRGADLPHVLRATYEKRVRARISAERWLLYQLVHLSSLRTSHSGERPDVRRALSRALQRYFDEIFFHDVPIPTAGALCALDIDGVLETGPLGFSGLTAAGAATIRALILHGYRPILATGRSLDEVRERCGAYHLAGGVAEYGAVTYNHGTGSVRQLLADDARHDLDRLRAELGKIAGVSLDRDYRHAVRAYRLDSGGKRRGLSPEVAATALAAAGVEQRVRSIVGQAQTDFMVNHVDKGTGLRALAAEMDGRSPEGEGHLLAFAVGDTFSDIPMFALAAMAFAPAHADDQVRHSGVEILKRPYQSGLALAAGRLLGHPPCGCRICHETPQAPDTRLFLDILAAQESGTLGIVKRALHLAIRIRRT